MDLSDSSLPVVNDLRTAHLALRGFTSAAVRDTKHSVLFSEINFHEHRCSVRLHRLSVRTARACSFQTVSSVRAHPLLVQAHRASGTPHEACVQAHRRVCFRSSSSVRAHPSGVQAHQPSVQLHARVCKPQKPSNRLNFDVYSSFVNL